MKKISTKIVALITLCSILLSSIIGIASIVKSSSIINKEAKEKILSIVESRGNEYSVQTSKVENTVNELAALVLGSIDISKVKDNDYMKDYESNLAKQVNSLAEINKGIAGMYINFDPSFTSGTQGFDVTYIYDEEKKQGKVDTNCYAIEEYREDNEDMDWYYSAVKARKGVWSNPYIDSVINLNMISFTMPIYINNQLVAVAGIDMSFEALRSLILNTRVYDTGNAFLLSEDYTFIVDKDIDSNENLSTMENGKYKYMSEEIGNKKSLVIQGDFKGKENIIGYYTLNNGQILGVKVPSNEVLKDLKNLIYFIIFTIATGLIVSLLIGLYFSRRLSKPIEYATDCIVRLSEFDLTPRGGEEKIMLSTKDEIGIMGSSIMRLREKFNSLVKQIIVNSENLATSSEELVASTEESKNSINQVANSMQSVTEGNSNQSNYMSQMTSITDKIHERAENIYGNIQVVKESVNNTLLVATEGNGFVNEVINQISGINLQVTESSDTINLLKEKSKKIEDIISMISEIAEQTNLLALNAAIEAARAGEQGRGFAVVAEEVRTLADASSKASADINLLIQGIQQDISKSVESMECTSAMTRDGFEIVEQTGEAFYKVSTSVQEVSSNTEEVYKNVTLIKDEIENMREFAKLANEISIANVNIAEEVCAATEEQNAIIHEISSASEVLAAMSSKLQEEVSSFII